MAALGLVAILAGARVALAQVDTIAAAPGCWFVIDISSSENCNSFCAGIGGTCDKDAMIHTGSPVGQHFWPDANLQGNWAIVECYTSGGDLWGANGGDFSGASDTCGYTSGQCSFPCACTLDECVAPTAPPTDAPTEAPTAPPTNAPTAAPTAAPTTAEPTAEPTAMPTAEPTATPEPTAAPTTEPTAMPTVATPVPTTAEPTAAPTPEPTAMPTPAPTAEPTAEPTTATPTAAPTPEPTAEPTAAPTPEPTAMPTPAPTPEPTAAPTPEPTAMPTPAPTPEPTAAPTPEPTAMPTPAPTPMPTATPTAAPTEEGFYWTTDVCGRAQIPGEVQSQHATAAVRCCDLAGESAMTPTPCQVGTYHEAAETCASLNMTICTSSNVYLACGSGCNHNGKLVWTSSAAAPEVATSENLLFAGDFESTIGTDAKPFMEECTNELFPVACVAAEEGSILVTLGSENRAALDAAIQRIEDDGLVLPSYRPMFLVQNENVEAAGADAHTVLLPFGLLFLTLAAASARG